MSMLVLSLFPGIGLLDMAFEEEGFCVVRGPDVLWGGDIKRFHPPAGRFDGIIGGPPCQAFSRLRHLVQANGLTSAENLIPEFERVVTQARPEWFLMENVPDAPPPAVDGYAVTTFRLNNRWIGGEQNRLRRLSFGSASAIDLRAYIEYTCFDDIDTAPAVCASGGVKPGIPKNGPTLAKHLGCKTAAALQESLRLQGLPVDFLDKAPFTLAGKHKVIGNGVPLPMGQALAKAVKNALTSSGIVVQ